ATLEDLARKYDLVLISSPPLLEVAYAGSVVNLADAALAIIPHGQSLRIVREFREQLDLATVPIVGYVYDRSKHLP
ncbi:MAG: hypothetical protein MUQ27_00315, partial [Acidimicrobiia bacterium]|nr:hypothetical protein [Acidimicrobiia bacterium]